MQHPIYLNEPIYIKAAAAVGGHEEGQGPLGEMFDFIDDTDRFGMTSFERAEGEMARIAMNIALKKASVKPEELSLMVAGDLQNQCEASSSGLFSFGVPFIGLYGACSTLTESLIVASSMMSNSERYTLSGVVTSSHNSAAERQFRTPLEYGAQRPPSAQWTATASGAFILSREPQRVALRAFMPGRVIDGYTKDAANMGSAMALSAFDTLSAFFGGGREKPSDFDLILTGDLGRVGTDILHELLSEKLSSLGDMIVKRHNDCGLILYDTSLRDVHSGGSGCGCSASVMSSYILPKIASGEIKRMCLMSTGALMSPGSVSQGEHIFGICPIVILENHPF